MNKREKILAGIIILFLLVWALYKVGITRVYATVSTRTGKLTSLKQTYEKCQEYMTKEDQIQQRYKELFPTDKNPGLSASSDPQKEFSEFVADLCKRLGFTYPTIEPPKMESIEKAEEYAFITLVIRTQGEMESISKLLKGFDREHVLVRNIELSSFLDASRIEAVITVARMVQVQPEKKGKAKPSPREDTTKFRSPTQSITPRKPVGPLEEK